MPKKFRIPTYRFHKGSGQAVVVLDGTSIYLGKWSSAESREKYERVIAEWLVTRHRPQPASADRTGSAALAILTVEELILAFWRNAQQHYRHADGTPTRECKNLRDALRPVRKLYGTTPAADFGPLAHRATQEEMVRAGLCRTVINDRVKRIRRAFRWTASVELIPVSVVQSLETVPALKKGRCSTPESPGDQPVDWGHVEATLPHLPRPVAAMIYVMRHSNCR